MKLRISTRIIMVAVLLLIIAVAFVAYALSHPEMSFNMSVATTLKIYGIYIIVLVILFALGIFIRKKGK